MRLLDRPFKDAQDRDGRYLLSLEPDRMLHNFRVNAGLVPKAPVYGGWESVETWADIRAPGHTLGHCLTACALMYASTGNDEFKKRCDYIVRELEECQTAAKTRLINAFPDNTTQIDNLVRRQRATGLAMPEATEILGRAVDAGYPSWDALVRHPWITPIHGRPGFADVVRRAELARQRAEAAFREAGGLTLLGLS